MHTDTPQRVLDMIDVRNADKSGDLNWSWSHERTAKTPMEELAFIWSVFDSTQMGVLEASGFRNLKNMWPARRYWNIRIYIALRAWDFGMSKLPQFSLRLISSKNQSWWAFSVMQPPIPGQWTNAANFNPWHPASWQNDLTKWSRGIKVYFGILVVSTPCHLGWVCGKTL